MEQLKALEQSLIDAMAAKQMAIDADEQATAAYDLELARLLETYPVFAELQSKRNAAKEAAKEAKDKYAVEKYNAVQVLLELPDPEDIKSIDACSYQYKKMPILLPNDELVMRLVEANAFGLLLPDRKQIEKFVIDNAFKDDDNNYLMPEWIIRQYKRAIDVKAVIKPTISDAKLAKVVSDK